MNSVSTAQMPYTNSSTTTLILYTNGISITQMRHFHPESRNCSIIARFPISLDRGPRITNPSAERGPKNALNGSQVLPKKTKKPLVK